MNCGSGRLAGPCRAIEKSAALSVALGFPKSGSEGARSTPGKFTDFHVPLAAIGDPD
ncbi:MAG: hypothetical protein JWR69_1028 [Pedosphaera sp.]|nr:hypothetical protein [Pedosphaera sp.]